ncbi:MAG: DHH family phosphoesterase [Lachnospiraceae bacterium]|nr:DHH family phosphoesterase [Lachnospiraceae bacterium]
MEVTGLSGKTLSSYHLGFILGPCINAAGRIDSADEALMLLLEKDEEDARERAVHLRDLNESRKAMTEKALEAATELAGREDYVNQKVLVLFVPDCHESVAGIVAGKVRERFNRPAFILCRAHTPDGRDCLKGSGRSIEAYNMFEGMSLVGDVFLQFGGHSQAAGLSILPERLEEFRQRINEGCSLTEEELQSVVKIDMELPFYYVNLNLARELELLEPVGTGNEAPLFAARNITVSDMWVCGKSRNVLKCRLSDGKERRDGVYFGEAEVFMDYVNQKAGEPLSMVYSISVNEYRGEMSPQITIRHFR